MGDVSKQYMSTLMHFLFISSFFILHCWLYQCCFVLIFLKTWHNSIIQWVHYISVYIVAHYVKSMIYLFDGRKKYIRMLSVSQSMANRKTFQQFALINSEIVSVMDYSDGLDLKVHFLVMLEFLWLIVYCKRYWFQRHCDYFTNARTRTHTNLSRSQLTANPVLDRVRVICFFSENQKIIMEHKYEKMYTPIW